MKIYRTKESLFNYSMETQILELFLFGLLDNVILFSFEQLMEMCPDNPTKEQVFETLVSLLNDMVLYETAQGVRLNYPLEAMHRAGFYTADVLHLVPEGTELLSLTDRATGMLENNSMDDVVEYLAELIGPQLEGVNDGNASH